MHYFFKILKIFRLIPFKIKVALLLICLSIGFSFAQESSIMQNESQDKGFFSGVSSFSENIKEKLSGKASDINSSLETIKEAQKKSSDVLFKEEEDLSKITEPVKENGKIFFNEKKYTILEVSGGDVSGEREPNVAVNIGFGEREYWAFTNEFGQLEFVYARKIILQNDKTEPVNENGRYYDRAANVEGIETNVYDRGHVIADSLGGVANAYNITPQDSFLNREGEQSQMEGLIRESGGCSNFIGKIKYPNSSTQIPESYMFKYDLEKELNVKNSFENKK